MVEAPVTALSDVDQFADRLTGELAGHWRAGEPIFWGRAPGRLDVMGGIADYSGALVCEAPLDLACHAAAQRRADDRLVLHTLAWPAASGSNGHAAPVRGQVDLPVAALFAGPSLCTPQALAERLAPEQRWARYPLGVLWVLLEAGLVHLAESRGLTLVLSSQVPAGAGVSSSAAVEVATLQALLGLFGLALDPLRRAQLCQRAENLVVGAPCGIMDQVTSLLGQPHALLRLRCQPHEVLGPLQLPEGVRVIGLDSGVKHSVGGSKYTDARVAAFMGQKIIAERIRTAARLADGQDPTGGYLARVSPEDYVARHREHLPIKIKGAEFLARWGASHDRVTTIDPARTYRVRSRTEHHIYEARRVEEFAAHLAEGGRDENRLVAAGELMYASHWSYGQRCGLGSIETEFLVTALRAQGVRAGIYGAKITGGGSGGTVAVLCRTGRTTDLALQAAVDQYEARFAHKVQWFTGTGPGAAAWGVRQITL